MPLQKLIFAPDYLQFYISGTLDFDAPIPDAPRRIIANDRCISVPCIYYYDGDTEVLLGGFSEIGRSDPPAFDGYIETETRAVIISDVGMTEYLKAETPDTRSRIRIWMNHPTQPDKVAIAVGD